MYWTQKVKVQPSCNFLFAHYFWQNIFTPFGLIRGFVFIGRPYFHKNKKYEYADQLTEATIKGRTMQLKN